MQLPPTRATLIALLLAFGAKPSPAADLGSTVAIGRPPFQSELHSAAEGTIVFKADGQTTPIKAKDLVTWGAPVDPRQGPQLLLADGGLLIADLVKSDNDRLTVDSYLFGQMTLPLEELAGILFYPPADSQLRDRLKFRVRDATSDTDRLILDNGDELTGTVVSLTDEAIELESSVGKVKVELIRVTALVFNPTLQDRQKPMGLRTLVGFRDGSRLMAGEFALAEQALIKSDGAEYKTTPDKVVYLQPVGGGVTYLSDIKPTGYRHVPFLELPWSWQADRNVAGTHLRAGSRLYLKGIGMHSASRLSFPLDGSRRKFEAELAIDSQTGGRGSVVFRVFFDTEQAFASQVVRGGEAPVPVSLEIPDEAKTLSLIVDFAERGDEQDHANWLNARLVE